MHSIILKLHYRKYFPDSISMTSNYVQHYQCFITGRSTHKYLIYLNVHRFITSLLETHGWSHFYFLCWGTELIFLLEGVSPFWFDWSQGKKKVWQIVHLGMLLLVFIPNLWEENTPIVDSVSVIVPPPLHRSKQNDYTLSHPFMWYGYTLIWGSEMC